MFNFYALTLTTEYVELVTDIANVTPDFSQKRIFSSKKIANKSDIYRLNYSSFYLYVVYRQSVLTDFHSNAFIRPGVEIDSRRKADNAAIISLIII